MKKYKESIFCLGILAILGTYSTVAAALGYVPVASDFALTSPSYPNNASFFAVPVPPDFQSQCSGQYGCAGATFVSVYNTSYTNSSSVGSLQVGSNGTCFNYNAFEIPVTYNAQTKAIVTTKLGTYPWGKCQVSVSEGPNNNSYTIEVVPPTVK